MTRPKLSSPDQALPVRLILGVYKTFASLKMAVVLLSLEAFSLGLATFYERVYGLNAVHFGLYGSWWFVGLHALLGVTIFCAASIRYPWKRHQTGFVITHIGLLTLLTGCLISWMRGIDAQMLIYEGGMGRHAYEDQQYFQLVVHRQSHSDSTSTAGGAGDEAAEAESAHIHDHDAHESNVELLDPIPFASGPFNWQAYDRLPLFPWRLAHRDRGVIYDQDGIRLEVLDYFSNSEPVDAPALRLEISAPRRAMAAGGDGEGPLTWVPLDLNVRRSRNSRDDRHRFGLGSSQRLGGGQISFWLASGQQEIDAFLQSAPRGPLGEKGQVVLLAAGERFQFLVEEKLDVGRFPLGETGLEVELVEHAQLPEEPAANRATVELRVFRDEEAPLRMLLFAGNPELNMQDVENSVFGSFWAGQADASTEELLRGQGGSRIDVIQGQDLKLYYRYWNRREVVVADSLPEDGTAVDAFRMPIGTLKMRVSRHVAAAKPRKKILPVAFNHEATPMDSRRAAKLRLTVDGNEQEFWLLGEPPTLLEDVLSPLEQHLVAGRGRTVAVSMPLSTVDVGFQIRLRPEGFERKLDPGTSQPSHFGSQVDFIDGEDDDLVLREAVQISMNAPVDFTDPGRDRSYRLFQEAYRGPFMAGTPMYREIARRLDEPPSRDQLFITILTVNYDPGRWVKYTGCLLVAVGIVTMFYMRAYFFTRRD